MDVLEPWLAATIEGKLGEALRHREDSTNRHQSSEEFRALSYDDGSNLRILSARKGSVVQITKFLTFEEPIQVTLSDSVVRVNALITNQASQKYAKQNRRKLTEGTVGGLIQLHEFEIVATHLGPRDKRLTLYVKDFKSIGANGSGNFGVAPQAIESREGTKELLKKLADLRKHGWDAHSEQSATVSPIHSQPSTQTSEAGHDQDTQVGFATQAPRSRAPISSKSKPSNPTVSVSFGSISTAKSVKSLAPPMRGKHRDPPAGTLTALQAPPHRPSVNETLLGLLRNCRGVPPPPRIISEPTIEQLSGRTEASTGPPVIEDVFETSRDITVAPSDGNAREASVGTSKRKRQSPNSTPRKKVANDLDFHRVDKDRESLAVNHDLDKNARSGSALNKASINTLRSRRASLSVSESAEVPSDAPPEASIDSVLKLTSSASGQNTGRNRINSRDVTIPKDQGALLSRADSWLPAEPGQREPTANIPISLLKTLNRKADFCAQRPRMQRNGTMTPSVVNDQTADSESDVPVSSGQWPASPERDQLPPDSSPVNAEHSDHSVQKMSKHHRPVLSSRRQSHASISSRSMLSGRPSPISARRPSRESGSPSMISPGLLSPSVASSSAGEEVHPFKCQAPGCDKSYKKPAGLKYHMDRHHPSVGSLENLKCPVKDCTKSYTSPGGLKYHVDRHHDGNTAPLSHSGRATPTFSDASTPILPSLDQRSRTPRDEKVVKRSSSASSVLKGNLPPNAHLTLIQPTTRSSDETHIAKEPLSPLLPASPTPESDLELIVPLALNEKTNSIASSAPMQQFPSTASQPQDPFTQVKRTPYVNGLVQNKPQSESRILSSPLKASLNPLINGTIIDDTEFVSSSVTSGPETSTTETQGENGSSNTFDDQCFGAVAARLSDEIGGQNVADSDLEKPDELIADVQQESRKTEAATDESDNSSHIMTESRRQGSGLDQPSLDANANLESALEQLPTPEHNHIDPLIQFSMSDHAAQLAYEMKRKFADSSFVSPSVAKRQRRFKVPSSFAFTERPEVPRDPSEGARRYRQDFLASRRSSESSTPTMSPTVPHTVFPGTSSENPRDPAERARQMRQESLASRRSSESSTPTTSPRMQFTAFTGMTQAERQNAEVEDDIMKVIMQNQPVDADFERQKTELKELSAIPQMQEMKLVAAPLPNGTASIETDGDNAKPGAQDGPSFDHEAESGLSVAQSSDFERLNAEQSLVVQESSYVSNDKAQRSRSVGIHVSLQSSNHQEAENDFANAHDNSNQTVNLGFHVMVTGNDQMADTNEDGHPIDSSSSKVSKDLSNRTGETVEEASNAPTSEKRLNQAAESVTSALESLHQHIRVKENSDTHMPNQIASNPTPQRQLFTVDAEPAIPDDISIELISQQRLIGVDIDTPMPEVEVDQDITPVKPIARTSEPMNQTTTLSIAAPAFIAESSPESPENQPHLSPVVVEPAIPLSSPVLVSELKPVEEHQDAVQLPNEAIQQEHPSVSQNIFEKFSATYPGYPGDINHFAAMCRKISQLVSSNRMAHQSLWDDFIVRHKIEYSQYLRRCAEEAEDVVPFEDFYQTEIEEPRYQKRVINRRNLDEALALVAQKSRIKQVQVEPVKEDEPCAEPVKLQSTSESDPGLEELHHQYAPANENRPPGSLGTQSALKFGNPREIVRKPSKSRVTVDISGERVHSEAVGDNKPGLQPVNAASGLKEAASTGTLQEPSEPRVTIDLTEDDPPVDQPKKTRERGIPPKSRVPRLVDGVSVEQRPLQYRRDSSGSAYHVPNTPGIARGSHIPSAPQSMRSPLVLAKASTEITIKGPRRTLPWKDSDQSVLQRSPNATAIDSPKRSSSSDLRVRAEASSDTRLQASAKSNPNGAKQSQGLLKTCHRVIQSNWGIKAHELLEPEYYPGILSETMIELLAEIASKVNVGEARNRIKEAIAIRIRNNARRGVFHPSQDRKMLESDLEVVKGVAETSSMSTTSPFSLPHTNVAVEKQDEGTPSKWWVDDNSPFKSFARAYASIRRGNGNSFAKADTTEPEDAGKVHEAASGGVQLKKINFMQWNF